MEEVKSGETTTEYAVAQSTKTWSVVAMILGFIIASGSEILNASGVTADSKVGIIAGAVIALAALTLKTLVALGYIKARADVKSAASLAEVNKPSGPELGE